MSNKLVGLLGKHIAHSFSKKYFTEKFSSQGITNYSYENFPLESIELAPKLWETESSLVGMNVTIPYKESIIPYLTKLNRHAKQIGAVNVIKKRTDGTYKGYNTDYYGFMKSVLPLLEPHHKKALVLGTGGASKAVQYALKELLLDYKVVSRTPKKLQLSYAQLNKKIMKEYTIVINCTPLGTTPNTSQFPDIPYQFLGPQHLVFDLIYNPEETVFLSKAKAQGAQIKNGYEMLLLQADASWKIWKK
ncbi:MAG: shikimate dehydrogenase [Flavobacterium sp.]|nr:shikimate dehydrogenase [Flavobacterium sp.]